MFLRALYLRVLRSGSQWYAIGAVEGGWKSFYIPKTTPIREL